MRKTLLLAACAILACSTGCVRARVTTEIHPDGSFTRTIAMTGTPPQQGMTMTGVSTVEDTFVLPSGTGWKVVAEPAKPGTVSAVSAVNAAPPAADAKQGEVTKTFERVFPAGSPDKGDFKLKGGKPGMPPKLVNEVTVTKIGPNRYEYKETLRWTGTPPKPPEFKPEDLATIKAKLPPALATDENARGLAEKSYRLMMPMMFGPGDPLLAMGWMHPELAQRRMMQKIGGTLLKAIDEQFGDKLTQQQKRELAMSLITKGFDSTKPSQPDPTSSADKDSTGIIPLTFVLRGPGKLISTNGEYDELSGEVFWALYPEAASFQPVVLTAVYEVQ